MDLRERLEELQDLPHGTAEMIAMEVQSTLERQEEMFAERLRAANLQQWVMAIALMTIAMSMLMITWHVVRERPPRSIYATERKVLLPGWVAIAPVDNGKVWRRVSSGLPARCEDFTGTLELAHHIVRYGNQGTDRDGDGWHCEGGGR